MARIKSYSPFQNLTNLQVFTIDSGLNSEYFKISELTTTLTGGKNAFLIEGSPFLKETTEVKIEILDVEGNPVYFEPGDGIPEYYEGTSKVISMHVYDDTPIGPGKITILGELKNYIGNVGEILDIPEEWQGIYNVKWEQNIIINKNLNNKTIVRFYQRPLVSITEIVKPLFNKTSPTLTQSGSVVGIPQLPSQGQDLRNWNAGTFYKLRITDSGIWTTAVDENNINIPSLGYGGRIIEVLNNKEVLVDVPYTINNDVQSFNTASYEVTYQDIENGSTTDTGVISSFGIIDITRLKTFAGDVARVKIFRKSRNTAGDFQLVQESKLESNELLRDLTILTETEVNYGFFSDSNLSTYWVTSSDSHPTTINNSVLASSVKFDYNTLSGSIQTLSLLDDVSISENSEYTLSFRTLISGSVDSTKTLRAYISGTNGTQDFISLNSSNALLTREEISQNIITTFSGSAKLVFEVTGDDWYISNVSLRNSQDTSFSPDEFTILQDIPRKLETETFDFRFEFYDINNNYIPVDVITTKEFDGGNDFSTGGGTGGSFITFESDRNAFRFSSGSVANPPFQQIQFIIGGNTSGSITYASSAFDIGGTFIDPLSYTGDYPGAISNPTTTGGLVTVASFSGSDDTFTVGSIIYTASIDGFTEYETIFRLEDGESFPALTVTSNANQFIYEPTTLSPKPSGQSINIRAKRTNLESTSTILTVNSSSDSGNPPPLIEGGTDTVTGITTYSITSLQYSASNAGAGFPQTTYSFTGSDVFGNNYSDEVTLSPVINFDGISIVLSNETSAFRANSVGAVSASEFNQGDGEVDVRLGNNVIQHSDGLVVRNSFDIVGVTGSSGVTVNESSPITNTYGISAMTEDTGSVILDLTYLAGDNTTTVDFRKKVTYSKVRSATPVVNFVVNPQSQGVESNAEFSVVGTPDIVTLNISEAGTAYSYNGSGASNPFEYSITSVISGSISGPNVQPNTPTNEFGTNGVATIEYRNSENTLTTGIVNNFYVGVSVQGGTGSIGPSGSAGVSGTKVATDTVYYQISAATAPSTPSATNYTLSTSTFTGLSGLWGGSAPIFSGSNGSKYWFSKFTAEENTPNGNVASGTNLSFSSPQQAIGFAGLVTFTGADSVNNGEGGELTFGSSGNTEIRGDVITTGTIKSTNYSAGTLPYTNTGTIIYMNNGAIYSENFGIDTSGNSFFRGDLTGASGTFSGTVTIGGTPLTSTNTLNSNTTSTNVGLGNVQNLNAQNQAQTGINAGTVINNGGIVLSGGGVIKTINKDSAADTTSGIFLGHDGNNNYDFAIGNELNSMIWDGSEGSLTINGNITGGTININNGRFQIDSTGSVTFANSGSIDFVAGSVINLGNNSRINGGILRSPFITMDTTNISTTGIFWSPSGRFGGQTLRFQSNGSLGEPSRTTGYIYGAETELFGSFDNTHRLILAARDGIGFRQLSGQNEIFRFSMEMDTGNFSATGNITAYASDDRLKYRLGNIPNPLDKLKSLDGFLYKWNDVAKNTELNTDDDIHIGTSAQQVQKLFPDIVFPAPFDVDKGKSLSGENYLTIQYEKLTPLLIEAVKELSNTVDELRNEINQLKKDK